MEGKKVESMKFSLDFTNSVSKKVHFNIDGVRVEVSDLSNVSQVIVSEDSGEIFVDAFVSDGSFSESESVDAVISDESPSESESVDTVISDEVISEAVSKVTDTHNEDLDNKLDAQLDSNTSLEADCDDVLFKKLSELRRKIAYEKNVPPFYIFHDKSLRQMATILPCDFDEMKSIKGVGDAKLNKYGAKFISVIQEYLDKII